MSIVHRPSSIVHRPSSIVHRPSSIVHRPSSIVHLFVIVGLAGCYNESNEVETSNKLQAPITFEKGSNFNLEQMNAWAQSTPGDVVAGNLFLKANLSQATAKIGLTYDYNHPIGAQPPKRTSGLGSGVLISSDKVITAAHVAEKMDYVINYKLLLLGASHVYKDKFNKMSEHNIKLVPFLDNVGAGTRIVFDQRRIHFDDHKKETYLDDSTLDWFSLVRWKQIGLEPLTQNDGNGNLQLLLFKQFVASWPVVGSDSLKFEHWSSDNRDVSTMRINFPKQLNASFEGVFPIKDFRFFPGVFFSSVLAYKAPQTAGGPSESTPQLPRPVVGSKIFMLSHNYRNTKYNPPGQVDYLTIDRGMVQRENLIHYIANNLSGIVDKPGAASQFLEAEMSFVPEEASTAGYDTNINFQYGYMIKTTLDTLEGSSGGGYFTFEDKIGKYFNFFELQGVFSNCQGKGKCDSVTGTIFTDGVVDENGVDSLGDKSKYSANVAAFSEEIVNEIYADIGNNGLPYLGVPAYDECVKKAANNTEREMCEGKLVCTAGDSELPNKCLFRPGLDKIQRGSTTVDIDGGGTVQSVTTTFKDQTEEGLQKYADEHFMKVLMCHGGNKNGKPFRNLNVGLIGGISKDGKGVGALGIICAPRAYTEWTMNWDFLYVNMLYKVGGNLRGAAELLQVIDGTGSKWNGGVRRLFSQFYNNSWAKIPLEPRKPTGEMMLTTPATQFCPPGFVMKGLTYNYAKEGANEYLSAITKIHCVDIMRRQPHSEDRCFNAVTGFSDGYPCTINLFADSAKNPIQPSTHPHYGRSLSQPIGQIASVDDFKAEVSVICKTEGYYLAGFMIPEEITGKVKSIEPLCGAY